MGPLLGWNYKSEEYQKNRTAKTTISKGGKKQFSGNKKQLKESQFFVSIISCPVFFIFCEFGIDVCVFKYTQASRSVYIVVGVCVSCYREIQLTCRIDWKPKVHWNR